MQDVHRGPSDLEYYVGDDIKCFHGPLVYEAKILKKRKSPSGTQYYVHYKGWKRKWDEWIGDTRIASAEDAKIVSPAEGDENSDAPELSENISPISKRRKFPKNKELCSDIFSSSRIVSAFKALADFDLYSKEHYGEHVFDHYGYLPNSKNFQNFVEILVRKFGLTKAERKLLNVDKNNPAPVYRLFRTIDLSKAV